MGERTKIAWCDASFNIAWGCTEVSSGCSKCYARELAKRRGLSIWGKTAPRRTFGEKHWNEPIKWNRKAESEKVRRRVFCSSMADVFEDHPTITAERETRLWPLIEATPWLDWLLLTKRPERLQGIVPWGYRPWHNVWIGASIEEIEVVGRTKHLVEVPAQIRFVSFEPALEAIHEEIDLTGIHWVIYGGESGRNFRPDNDDWARGMRDLCREKGVAFFYKQASGRLPGTRPTLDGQTIQEFPLCQTTPA